MRNRRCIAACAAAWLAAGMAARADAFFIIDQPTPAYVAQTTRIDIGGLTEFNEYLSIAGGGLTVDFNTPMMRLTVPGTWNTWNSPPATETATPPVLWTEQLFTVTMTLSTPQRIFGFEAQPELSDFEQLIATYFDAGLNPLGSITRDVSGNGGALLFAASSATPIAVVEITDQAGFDFATANVRFAPAQLVAAPPTDWLVAVALALLLVWRLPLREPCVARRRVRRPRQP